MCKSDRRMHVEVFATDAHAMRGSWDGAKWDGRHQGFCTIDDYSESDAPHDTSPMVVSPATHFLFLAIWIFGSRTLAKAMETSHMEWSKSPRGLWKEQRRVLLGIDSQIL